MTQENGSVNAAQRFTEWLRSFRQKRNMTTRELARQLGFSQAYVWQVEAGKTPPSERFLRRLAEEFDAPEAYLAANRLLPADFSISLRVPLDVLFRELESEYGVRTCEVGHVWEQIEGLENEKIRKLIIKLLNEDIPPWLFRSYLLLVSALVKLMTNQKEDSVPALVFGVVSIGAAVRAVRDALEEPHEFEEFLRSMLPGPHKTAMASFLASVYGLLKSARSLPEERLGLALDLLKRVLVPDE